MPLRPSSKSRLRRFAAESFFGAIAVVPFAAAAASASVPVDSPRLPAVWPKLPALSPKLPAVCPKDPDVCPVFPAERPKLPADLPKLPAVCDRTSGDRLATETGRAGPAATTRHIVRAPCCACGLQSGWVPAVERRRLPPYWHQRNHRKKPNRRHSTQPHAFTPQFRLSLPDETGQTTQMYPACARKRKTQPVGSSLMSQLVASDTCYLFQKSSVLLASCPASAT